MHKWDPADYERSSSAQYNWAMALISTLSLKGAESILDIGCGNGKITSILAGLVPKGRALGIDLSEEMIGYAKSNYPEELHSNLSFQVGDASCLGFREEFDLVVSFACLHWVEDHLQILKGVKRGLKPGGRVLFSCGGKGNAAQILDLTDELSRSERWGEYFREFKFPYHFYRPEEYRIWLEKAGLNTLRVELVPKDMVHRGQAGLEGIIRNTWLPYLERLPLDLRAKFVGEVAARYLQLYPLDENGLAHVQMMRLEVEAQKPN
jgi:trans-aconitate methyltransferase